VFYLTLYYDARKQKIKKKNIPLIFSGRVLRWYLDKEMEEVCGTKYEKLIRIRWSPQLEFSEVARNIPVPERKGKRLAM
jgi:hypothetical protein